MLTLVGTAMPAAMCHPAPSSSSAACATVGAAGIDPKPRPDSCLLQREDDASEGEGHSQHLRAPRVSPSTSAAPRMPASGTNSMLVDAAAGGSRRSAANHVR